MTPTTPPSRTRTRTRTAAGLPIVSTRPAPDGLCGEGGRPGVQYICSGTYTPRPSFPAPPSDQPCSGTASQCLDALDPSMTDDIAPLLGVG
jgi:hypothetical protein